MDFQFKNNIKMVVDFEVGEKILIKGWGPKLNGEHTITNFKPNFGGCESGIMVKITGYGDWIDLGWLTKINNAINPKTDK